MIELKSSRKQENSTPWVGRTFGNILLLEGLPAVSTCCREPFAFHIGREHSKFIFFLALLDIFEQNFGRQKRRGGRCQSKPLIIPSLKLTMGLIDQYHRGWRFKNCADYLFCSFDFFYFWSGKRRRRNWFSDLYVNKW